MTLTIERAAITARPEDIARKLQHAPAWVRALAAKPAPSPATPKPAPATAKPTTAVRSLPPVIGWLAGTCCPGVSKPCYGHADGETLPEQFTGNAWRSMLEQLRTGSLHVPLRLGHDGPDIASTRGLDLLFTSHAVYGLEFEARLRDTPACRKVLERMTTTGWGVSIGFKRGKQWTVDRPGVGRLRVIDDAVLDHVALIDGTANRRAAYSAARCHAARSTGTTCPHSVRADVHGWAFRILAIQAGATR